MQRPTRPLPKQPFSQAAVWLVRREFTGPPLGWSLVIAVGGLGAYGFYELLVWRNPSIGHLHSWAAGAALAGALLLSEVVVGALVPGFPNFLFGVAVVAITYVLFSLGNWAPTSGRSFLFPAGPSLRRCRHLGGKLFELGAYLGQPWF